ncbi:MAG: DUF2029 domain-containing protein [Anaerolineae bacterium]|nr:DUF2029 domain-containing protein [Anaerolineae bacterium]
MGNHLYRLTSVALFVAAVGVLVQTLPQQQRLRSWVLGLAALTTINAFAASVWLGQVDALIVFALAVCLWGIHTGRLGAAGVGLGVATSLKISPGVLLIYLIVRRQWRAVGAAAFTMMVLMVAALLIGRPEDLLRFVLHVSPPLAQGSRFWQNQALPALLARLTTSSPDLIAYATGLGLWRVATLLIVVGGVIAVWWQRRDQPLTAPEAVMLILVGLLAGPITWNHYLSWALVILASAGHLWPSDDFDNFPRRSLFTRLLLVAWATLVVPMPLSPNAGSVLYWVRTSLPTLGLMMLIVSQSFVLVQTVKHRSKEVERP